MSKLSNSFDVERTFSPQTKMIIIIIMTIFNEEIFSLKSGLQKLKKIIKN